MIVVSDTSPISSLFLIGQLELLPAIFSNIIVPQKVMAELLVLEREFGHDLSSVKIAAWIEVRSIQANLEVERLAQFLDAGESEAIALAKELNADYLLVDDRKGREAASEDGLKTMGVLGVFMLSKRAGFITNVRPLMDDFEGTS